MDIIENNELLIECMIQLEFDYRVKECMICGERKKGIVISAIMYNEIIIHNHYVCVFDVHRRLWYVICTLYDESILDKLKDACTLIKKGMHASYDNDEITFDIKE